ncbi:c-type cytochrome [Ideonella livida]|uniref:Cytochrome c n=1 Tax=Ideonella livida TaxID=2707176 RepID=A0A7C9TJS1_9BURK|nr:cytochrome c [Ideonella livida]NDY91244.1 cytochrome c [Ideonella livida]
MGPRRWRGLSAGLGLAALCAGGGVPAAAQPALVPASPQALARGAEVFGGVCLACHGAQGQGTAGLAPALAGPLAPALASAEGRGYVLRVLLHGLSGRIVSQGQTFMGAMPAQSNFHDEDLAAVGAHLARLNGLEGAPFTATEVATARAERPAPTHKALRELRAKVMP